MRSNHLSYLAIICRTREVCLHFRGANIKLFRITAKGFLITRMDVFLYITEKAKKGELMESGTQEIHKVLELLIYLGAFGIVAVAARKLAGVLQKFKLPLISGFLVIGIISGPELLGLIEPETLNGLNFLNDVALAFIAFAVGSELYLTELRSRMKHELDEI